LIFHLSITIYPHFVKKVKYFFLVENKYKFKYNIDMTTKHKDFFRNILFLCGITLDNEYNFICAKCISNPDHEKYKKCRNEYGKIDPLAQFYCIINYHKYQEINPDIKFQQVMLIVKQIDKAIKDGRNFAHLLSLINIVRLELKLLDNGVLNIEQATHEYRTKIISILDRFLSKF